MICSVIKNDAFTDILTNNSTNMCKSQASHNSSLWISSVSQDKSQPRPRILKHWGTSPMTTMWDLVNICILLLDPALGFMVNVRCEVKVLQRIQAEHWKSVTGETGHDSWGDLIPPCWRQGVSYDERSDTKDVTYIGRVRWSWRTTHIKHKQFASWVRQYTDRDGTKSVCITADLLLCDFFHIEQQLLSCSSVLTATWQKTKWGNGGDVCKDGAEGSLGKGRGCRRC